MIIQFKNTRKTIPIVLVLLFLMLASCSNTFDPLDEEKGSSSIFGFLDANSDTSVIRIKDLNVPLDNVSDSIDAVVTLKNTKSGVSTILEDSIVIFDNVKTHNFFTAMKIEPETTYSLNVVQSDGDAISATSTTPGIAQVNVVPEGPKGCDTPIVVTFNPVKQTTFFQIIISFSFNSEIERAFYYRTPLQTEDYDGTVPLIFTANEVLFRAFGVRLSCKDVGLRQLSLRYIHYGPDANLDTVQDMLNVPGGAGTFIGVYIDQFIIPINPLLES